jgi:AcrR family transcriptional regulator
MKDLSPPESGRTGQMVARAANVSVSRGRGQHHGDAKNALLAAAETMLDRGGLADLSLRAIAEAAGVSRQAPYNHFRDKKALLAALARAGFEDLGQAIAAIREGKGQPRERLADAAAAYIGFAVRRRSLFRLMFSREVVDINDYADARHAAEAAFSELRKIIEPSVVPTELESLSLAAWSIVHGYATLSNELFHTGDSASHRSMAELFGKLILAGTT